MTTVLRTLLLWLSRQAALGNALESIPFADSLIGRFVAGQSHEEAVETARPLVEAGYRITFSLLGEDVADEVAAVAASDGYRELLQQIANAGLASESKIAVKPTLLGLGLSFETAQRNLNGILEAARWTGVGVELDMERSNAVDDTLALYRSSANETADLHIAIQAYLRRSAADIDALIADRIARVRLVKGAYEESADVAYQTSAEIERAFHAIERSLLEPESIAGGASLAVATHDLPLIAATRTRSHRKRTPDGRWEVQMLYGVRRQQQQQLLAEGYPLRVYLPYGRNWFPYFMRRLAERPANLGFALRSLFSR